jgi:hypothetical protein
MWLLLAPAIVDDLTALCAAAACRNSTHDVVLLAIFIHAFLRCRPHPQALGAWPCGGAYLEATSHLQELVEDERLALPCPAGATWLPLLLYALDMMLRSTARASCCSACCTTRKQLLSFRWDYIPHRCDSGIAKFQHAVLYDMLMTQCSSVQPTSRCGSTYLPQTATTDKGVLMFRRIASACSPTRNLPVSTL